MFVLCVDRIAPRQRNTFSTYVLRGLHMFKELLAFIFILCAFAYVSNDDYNTKMLQHKTVEATK